MGRNALTPTPNIPWCWDHDDEGNTLLSIRDNQGGLAEVVLSPQEAYMLVKGLSDAMWERDETARAFRLGYEKHS